MSLAFAAAGSRSLIPVAKSESLFHLAGNRSPPFIQKIAKWSDYKTKSPVIANTMGITNQKLSKDIKSVDMKKIRNLEKMRASEARISLPLGLHSGSRRRRAWAYAVAQCNQVCQVSPLGHLCKSTYKKHNFQKDKILILM